MDVFFGVAAVFIVGGNGAWLAGRISQSQSYGMDAIGQGALSIGAIRAGHSFPAVILAALCAFSIWQWWNGGGGSDTKRRLRALRAAFRGVRRTAPVAGGS